MAEQKQWTEDEIIKLLQLKASMDILSLNQRINLADDSAVELQDIIVDAGPSPQDIAERNDIRRRLESYLKKLSPREEMVIRLRYGLDGGSPMTLEAIALQYGVTRERIRQVEGKAVKKLRKYIVMRDGVLNIKDF